MDTSTKPYISKVTGLSSIFSGCVEELVFQDGLNILCGANGTGKSKILNFIYGNKDNPGNVTKGGDSQQPLNLLALSAKRNYPPKNSQQVDGEQRQARKDDKQYVQESKSKAPTASIFSDYTSVTEWLHSTYETYKAPGDITSIDAVNKTVEESNEALKKVSNEWLIKGDWVDVQQGGRPEYTVIRGASEFPLSELSTGEAELLSIVLTLEKAKRELDVIIIDEPEAHLNWSLEESLFNYLRELSKEVSQVIVATHSQVALYDSFISRCIFLDRDTNGKVVVSDKLSEPMLRLLTGKAIKLLTGSSPSNNTIMLFVEDTAHSWLVESMLIKLKLEDKFTINIHHDGSGAIVNLYRGLKSNRNSDFILAKSRFIVDGDAKEQTLDEEDRKYFNQFGAYSVESYLFRDLNKLSKLTNKKTKELKVTIIESIKKDLTKKFAKPKDKKNAFNQEVLLRPSRLLLQSLNGSIFKDKDWWRSIDLKQASKDLKINNSNSYSFLVSKVKAKDMDDFFDGLKSFLSNTPL